MKNRFRLILTLILIALLGGTLIMKSGESTKTLRVAFPSALKVTSYEPTRISLDYEYAFLEGVFSTLVEMDTKGIIQPGIAEKAEWIGNELHFKIRDGLKTENGTPITADDVLFSLKRLLVLSGNTHGNFKDLVCPSANLKSVEDECPEMTTDGNSVILKIKEHKSFLLPMLAAIDFAIIPRSSVDPKTLNIINFKETSGPYYVSSDDEHGHIELRLNPHHYHASSNIPQIVKLVPTDPNVPNSSLKALAEGRVDHLTTVDAAKAEALLEFSKEHTEFTPHMTMNIRTLALFFTERGIKELSPEERLYIGQKARLAFHSIYKDSIGYEVRSTFFPSLGDGGLSEPQDLALAHFNEKTGTRPTHKVKIGLIRRNSPETWAIPLKEMLPAAEVYTETNVPEFKTWTPDNPMPHAFIAGTDIGFLEDINLITYSLNAGLLGLSKAERKIWLVDYMNTENKKDRMEKLSALHLRVLMEPTLVPLMSSPFAALIRKPWRMEFSELYANNQLWLIKIK